jgi:S-adenosylmethionine-diacylglycerol 3-amino-3-carboxypropyl transferase
VSGRGAFPAHPSGWFGLVYRNNLIYNQCWEDPAVDQQALALGPADRVLVITSAGCNALDYALSGAAVLAVDANPRQNHLLELKLAGLRALDYEAFFESAWLFRAIGSTGVLALLGVPRPQRSLVAGQPGGVAGFIRDCLDRVMSVCLLRDNYFWNVYLWGGYARESCPRYLSREGFARLRGGLADRISTRTATVTAALRREREPVSAFVLLDHLDWLVPHPELIEEEWRAIFAAAAPGARVIFRSGGPGAAFLPAAVRERLAFDTDRAKQLHAQDRVATYGSFHIARLAPV